MPRITPLEAPFDDDVDEQLRLMMPPGAPPIALFRTFVRNRPMAEAMTTWGRYELSRALSLSMRERELVIDRTAARCGCEYEWGVHVAFFGERVGLTDAEVASLTHGDPADPCWSDERERLLLEAADSLHDTSDIADPLWDRLAAAFSDDQLLDLLALCGWYHAISFVANGARLGLEDGTPRFADVAGLSDG